MQNLTTPERLRLIELKSRSIARPVAVKTLRTTSRKLKSIEDKVNKKNVTGTLQFIVTNKNNMDRVTRYALNERIKYSTDSFRNNFAKLLLQGSGYDGIDATITSFFKDEIWIDSRAEAAWLNEKADISNLNPGFTGMISHAFEVEYPIDINDFTRTLKHLGMNEFFTEIRADKNEYYKVNGEWTQRRYISSYIYEDLPLQESGEQYYGA